MQGDILSKRDDAGWTEWTGVMTDQIAGKWTDHSLVIDQ